MFKFITILLLLSNVAQASTGSISPELKAQLDAKAAGKDPDNVVLNLGDKAPYTGILFPTARAQRLDLITIDLTTCTKRLDLSNQDNQTAMQRVDNLQTTNTTLYTENTELHKNSDTKFWIGLVSGIGLMALSAWAYGQIHK